MSNHQMSGTQKHLLFSCMWLKSRVVEQGSTRTWKGSLKAERSGGVVYFNLCVQDCGGSEILCYLQIHDLICYRLKDPDRRLLGETKRFPLGSKGRTWGLNQCCICPKSPGGKEGRCGCLHVQRVVIHKWTHEFGRFPVFVVSRSTPAAWGKCYLIPHILRTNKTQRNLPG